MVNPSSSKENGVYLTDVMMNNITVKKNNALTDGYLPNTAGKVIPDKLLNALVYKYEKEGLIFTMEMSEVRNLLGLKSTKDDKRIYEAFKTLGTGMALRNFEYKGREVKWATANFCNAKIYKDKQNYVEVKIDDTMIAYLKQKYGYTPIEINICNQFKTKYGLKLYEMYLRYESLPNHIGDRVGTISRSLEELNSIFQTKYKFTSEMKRSIERGLKEIKKITNIDINCFYDKRKKEFVFSWEQEVKHLKNIKAFTNYVRKKYKPYFDKKLNKDIYPLIISTKSGDLKVDNDGLLYLVKENETQNLDGIEADKLWNWLYDLAKSGKQKF